MSNRIFTILDAVRENPKRGIPVLIGPTQRGKNHLVHTYGKARGLPLVPLDFHLGTPEENGGYPVRDPKTNKVTYSMPPALTTALDRAKLTLDDPFILFVDEIDKAHEDLVVCLLNIFSTLERRIRHVDFHDRVLIVGAMNEPKRALPDPLLARMLMIPFPHDDEYFESFPASIRSLIRDLYPLPKVAFPERPEAPGAVVTLEQWFTFGAFWEDEALRDTVIRGLFPEKQVPLLHEKMVDEPVYNLLDWVKKASPTALLANLVANLSKAAVQEKVDMLNALHERASNDPTEEVTLVFNSFVDSVPATASVTCTEGAQAKGTAALREKFNELCKEVGKDAKEILATKAAKRSGGKVSRSRG
jgi:hypothetical protein